MMIYTGMLIAGITAGYICLERHRPVEGILLLAGIAGSFAAISEQMGKEYGMTRKQLRVMLLFLMVGFFNFALNYNRYYTDETLLKRDQIAFKEMKILTSGSRKSTSPMRHRPSSFRPPPDSVPRLFGESKPPFRGNRCSGVRGTVPSGRGPKSGML